MQNASAAPPTLLSAFSFSRRKLLFAVLAAVVGLLAAYLVVHGSSTQGKSHKHHARKVRIAAVTCTAKSRTHARTCSSRARHPRKSARRFVPSPMSHYATALVPVLDRTRGLVDGAARGTASASGIDALGQVCAAYSPQIQIMADQVDGVPHPYPWYTTAGWYHHELLGIYHRLQGALNLCDTAASNGDSGSAATAVADLLAAASALRSTDDYVRWKATH